MSTRIDQPEVDGDNKIINIPVTLRLQVPASFSDDDARKLAEALVSESGPTVGEGIIEEALVEHLQAFDEPHSEAIEMADIWVY